MSGIEDGAVWNVYSYPDEKVLHVAASYEEAERWRGQNNALSFICPQWPEEKQ